MADTMATEARAAALPGLRGKNVLVTGGSSGIGQAIAVRFAEYAFGSRRRAPFARAIAASSIGLAVQTGAVPLARKAPCCRGQRLFGRPRSSAARRDSPYSGGGRERAPVRRTGR